MMDFSCFSSSSSSSFPPSRDSLFLPVQQAHHPNSNSFLVRLNHFLALYEDGADPSGIDCQNILHSAIGAVALKEHNTIIDLLEEANLADEKNPELPEDYGLLIMGADLETESSPLDTQVSHSMKDYSNYVVIEL